jgi:hypothetical protein
MIPQLSNSRQRVRAAWTIERLNFERSVALGFTLEASTSSAYDSHLNSYLNFCRLHGREVDPTPDTLSYYVVWLSHHIEPRSVDSYLSGIANKLELYFPQVREARRSALVVRTLKGCKRRHSRPIRRKEPLTLDDLAVVVCHARTSSDYDDTLFAALLVTGFKTLQRLGELVWPDSRQHQSYRMVTMRHTISICASNARYLLPHQKNHSLGSGHEVIIMGEPLGRLDPLKCFRDYLGLRDAAFPWRAELWLTRAGTIPTRTWFMRRLRHFFPDGAISGHSMRAGGATALAAAGVAPDLIRAAGRWSSDEFQKYIRKHPFLLHVLIHGGGG